MAKKEGEGEGKEGKVDMKALTQSVMEGLKPVFLQIGQHIKAQSETITTLQGTVEKLSAGGDGTDDGDHKVVVDDGKPLEELSRQELADSIVARVAKEVIKLIAKSGKESSRVTIACGECGSIGIIHRSECSKREK